MISRLFLVLMTLALVALTGCAAVQKPLEGVRPDASVESLMTPLTLSVRTGEKSMGARGYLVYKQPDRFHLVILSPFGLTLAEIFSEGDRIVCLIPSRNIAYSGRVAELPDSSGLRSWGMMRWVVERPPLPPIANGKVERLTGDGRRETVYFDSLGLVTRKVTMDGDEVCYEGYQAIESVPFPASIKMTGSDGSVVKIEFDEPEVNKPVEDELLKPRLDDVQVLPFSEFKGF